jgi:hypothetical protein
VLSQQADHVLFAVEGAADRTPFLFGRTTAIEIMAPAAKSDWLRAVGRLEQVADVSARPGATIGQVGSLLDDASRLLGASDAVIEARIAELLRMVH